MLKILVIDADSTFASLLGKAMVSEGHETRIASDAKYGLMRAKALEPDLVLVDTNLPGITGTQLIKELKPLVPGRIVVCAESNALEDVKAAIAAGASDYVLKSSGVDSIVLRVCPPDDSEMSDDETSGETSEVPASTNPPSRLARAPVKDGKRPFCVVVAHQDSEKRAFITEIVERLNRALHVIEVSSSAAAIAACAENRTVMLVIDWDMSDPPARTALRTVREAEHGNTIATFVTNKSHSPEKQHRALYEGALAFACEPWDDGSLEGQLKQALDLIRKRRRKAVIKAREAKSA
ncbi:MAG: response regulator [Chloroflexi bacterium]|nr:response regulator [Chloroflexota bacterium]